MVAAEKLNAELVDAALTYAAKGLMVFPCNPHNKRPLTKHGFEDASADPDQIRQWWAKWPNAMIGMPTGERSGFWALDVDDPTLFEGQNAVDIPATRRCDTGKGYHLLFRFDPKVPVSNAQRHPKRGWPFAELPGAEARGNGGYVIVPPSLHPSGKTYAWHDETTIAYAPDKLLSIVRNRRASNDTGEVLGGDQDTKYGLAALEAECENIRQALAGAQEAALNEASLKIGSLVAGGELSHQTGRSQLIAAALCMQSYDARQPWTPDNIIAKVDRSMADGSRNPRSSPNQQRDDGHGFSRASTDTKAATESSTPLPMIWWAEVTPKLNDLWLIKKLLPANGLCVVYGHPGSGKTFLALDLAFHVATGQDWHDRKVKQGLVVYVAAEGQAGLRNRIMALKSHYGTDQVALGLVPTAIDLQAHDADTPRLIELIKSASAECGHDPALIVIDTLSKTFGGGKENTDDMATYVANCGRVANEFECCVMPVHHRPKDAESAEPRGHSSLKGGADTVILVEDGLTKRATVTKQKDADIGERMLFNLLPVHLGQDEDGEDVTSCVVVPATVDMNMPADPIAKARAKLSDKNKIALRELGRALEYDGQDVPAEIPDELINRSTRFKVARVEDWRTRVLAALGTRSDNKPDTARRTFDRARDTLQSKGIIRVWEDYAWEL